MALATGTRLGRYAIVRQLGAGAMGEVYLAEDPHIDRKVAIKTVRVDVQEQATDSMKTQLKLRFEREAKAAGRLIHPHVVTLFDAGEVEGLFYLAFEFVDGPDLAARARRQPPLELKDILRIGREAAAALEAAHRVGIIHRDIKPSNLLLTSDGTVKVADFGIAALVGQGTHLTQTGSLIGTPQYLSPEQVKSEFPVDARSDLFSLGVVLYELLAGKRPFEGGTLAGLLYAVVASDPLPLDRIRPDLPPQLTDAIMRLLAKDPNDRFPNAAAFSHELAIVERELPEHPTEVRATVPAATDDRPTMVQVEAAAVPTRIETPVTTPVPSTRIETPVPPTRVEAPATPVQAAKRGGKKGWIAVAAIVVAIVGVIAAMPYLRPEESSKKEAAATSTVSPPVIETAAQPAQTTSAPITNPVTETSAPQPEPSAPEAQVVGGAVIFRVSPADTAVVRIDGLVRGLSGSLITLRPGRHEIEIVAEGFQTEKFLVESRAEAASPTEIPVTMVR